MPPPKKRRARAKRCKRWKPRSKASAWLPAIDSARDAFRNKRAELLKTQGCRGRHQRARIDTKSNRWPKPYPKLVELQQRQQTLYEQSPRPAMARAA